MIPLPRSPGRIYEENSVGLLLNEYCKISLKSGLPYCKRKYLILTSYTPVFIATDFDSYLIRY